jgi:RimJ/RimL family protein N-acetyltransferase
MLTGERVTLRAAREDDLDQLYELAAELETWEERSPAAPRPLSRPEYAERFTKSLTEPGEGASFVIEADGEVLGRCDIFDFDPLARNAEVGIALRAAARGQGYGTDALRVLVRYAFERRNLHRVYLGAIASNVGALASYRKVGFVEEGRRREHAWVRGSYQDEIVMGLLRSDWNA